MTRTTRAEDHASAGLTGPARDRPARARESGGAPLGEQAALLALQRSAGNRATALFVQRATSEEKAVARERANTEVGTAAEADYFAGNFLANHLEQASPELAAAKGGAGALSKGSKEARSQGYRKLEERSNVDDGGTGWGPNQRRSGTNTVILDFGTQTGMLMRSVNVAQIDELAAAPHVRYFDFLTEENVRAVTYSSGGQRSEQKGKAHLGAQISPDYSRYQINHLGGLE